MKKNMVIVGGGTAGWLAALAMQRSYGHIYEVTVIESSKIGILGAGEGTVPYFIGFLQPININVSDLIKHCGATIKNGIKFTNWKNDGTHYYHNFGDMPNAFTSNVYMNYPFMILDAIQQDVHLDQILVSSKASEKNLIKYSSEFSSDLDLGTYSLHFNAKLLADYLKRIGIERGVNVIDGIVIDEKLNDNGYITNLTVETESDNTQVDVDFLIDSTGFSRKFIKKYDPEWISYEKYLPVNRALPFFIEMNEDDDIPPYTEAIAMKYGWIWKIPVEGRYGCGYVFDSSLATDDEILKEAEEYFGMKLKSPKTFSFTPGVYRKVWNKNCLAIGLASGFIEPLEATSIWATTTLISFMNSCSFEFELDDDAMRNRINNEYYELNEQILNFVHFHYLSGRNDTDFWKKCENKNNWPKISKDVYDKTKTKSFMSRIWFKNASHFAMQSWIQIAHGIGLIDKKLIQELFDNLKNAMSDEDIQKYLDGGQRYLRDVDNLVNNFESHKNFLSRVKRS